MSDTKISEAAVEAAARAYGRAPQSCDGNEAMEIALTAALPHLHPQPAELVELQWLDHPQTLHAKAQWDAVADALGANRDCPDDVLAAALAATGRQQGIDRSHGVVGMKKIICKLFGHQPPTCGQKGWWSPGEEYAKVRLDGRDGIGREHARVIGECPRCGDVYRVCRIHVPEMRQRDAAPGVGNG